MSFIPPVISLQSFEAVARRRSFALAAAELHVTASAVSHQVAKLESNLGVRLFERSAHGVRISVAGENYLSRVAGALSAIAAATEDLRQGVSNSLYVHSAPSIASLWLMSRLHAFAEAYPRHHLESVSGPHPERLRTRPGRHRPIRYGVPNWPDLVVEPLFVESIVPLASPAFIQKHRLEAA